jgi:hypothetical protein
MATMFRVAIPDGGPATVSTGVVAFSTCAAGEIAVIVGDNVPRQRCGSELRETLERIVLDPMDPVSTVGGTNRLTYVGAPGLAGEQIPQAIVAQATAPDETQWGLVVGDVAANHIDDSSILLGALQRAYDQFVAILGL